MIDGKEGICYCIVYVLWERVIGGYYFIVWEWINYYDIIFVLYICYFIVSEKWCIMVIIDSDIGFMDVISGGDCVGLIWGKNGWVMKILVFGIN